MAKRTFETYPTYDGLGDIISETRAWYHALGLQVGGSLYSVIRASEGITGFVHAVAKTLKMHTISKKVSIVVEDMPAIAYVTPNSASTIVHVGSWLYSRDKMEKWHPAVRALSESDMLVLTLGLINGAVALDMIAKRTEEQRKQTMFSIVHALTVGYGRDNDTVYAVERNFGGKSASEQINADEMLTYISSAIHDMLAIKACLTEHRNASWAMFPLLLFREFFDDDFSNQAKDAIEKDDTLENLAACVSALRCFTKHSASILDVKTSVGINLIKAMLAGVVQDIEVNSDVAKSVISSEMLSAYLKEIRQRQAELQRQEKPLQGGSSEDGDESDNKKQQDNSKQKNEERRPNDNSGVVKDIESSDSSAPVNSNISDKRVKQPNEFKQTDEFGNETKKLDKEKAEYQERLSKNMKERTGKDADSSWLEQFMKLAFSGKVKFNRDAMDAPRPRTFKNVNEYIDFLKAESVYYPNDRDNIANFKKNMLSVYESIDKVSLKNLFMERTMDIEKSQPARSGIALIPTRIVNMFTDEKMFSPLPENETERESEVVILVDASGSMRGGDISIVDNSGNRRGFPLYDGVIGAAYAISEGLQRAHVNCSVFAHSTLPEHNDGVFTVRLTDQYSLNRLNEFTDAGKILSRNNGDSYAIEEMEQFFSQDGRDIGRTLIVLSDGQPACHAYRSHSSAREETKKSADKLRAVGIKVYSVSLTRDVVEDNNVIYGKENNFFPADELENGTVSLSPMLKKIVDIVAKNSARSADNVLTQG